MKSKVLSWITAMAFLALFFVGWILNIVTIINHAESMSIGVLLVRVIGIGIAPLGAVMGYV